MFDVDDEFLCDDDLASEILFIATTTVAATTVLLGVLTWMVVWKGWLPRDP